MRLRGTVSALALACAVATAGCSSDSEATGDGSAPTTTSAPAEATPGDFAERGDFAVGTIELTLPDGRRAVVWYPAADDVDPDATLEFDLASLLSPALQEQIPDADRPPYDIVATTSAVASDDGPFPILLFSHGYSGFPEQSANLVTHLASWGTVVIAPDHVERSLGGMLGTAAEGVAKSNDPDVLSAALDALIAEADTPGSVIEGLVDAERVAVGGHSAGAGAAYRTAISEPRIDGFISYSVGGDRLLNPEDGSAAVLPSVPGVVMAGAEDLTIPVASSKGLFDAMTGPKGYVEIAESGHLVFADLCLIGREQGGLAGLVKKIGLDLPENLLRLATDGCEPERLPVEDAFAAINHLSVSFLRWVFDIDEAPVAFDSDTANEVGGATITVIDEL